MKPAKRWVSLSLGYLLVSLLLVWLVQRTWVPGGPARSIPYSELMADVAAGRVESAHLRDDRIDAVLKPPADAKPGAQKENVTTARLPGVDETQFVTEMRQKGVELTGTIERAPWWKSVLFGWFFPIAALVGIYAFFLRRMGKTSGPLSVGKSRAKIYDKNRDQRVTFSDVAGVDEAKAELVEIVAFLTKPERYQILGARPPKGVLLVGAPGTGKTLLARAVAGEAGVPFFSLSGSEFVEMFVGVGAARVRDLFQQAKERAPCIVFIDELDAVGKSRTAAAGSIGGHDEREQTLNQLLAEMDGFDPGSGVVILAATNRPEILDRALLRAGRFDRRIVLERPDLAGREAILRVHAKKLLLDVGVDLSVIARRTPGMAGAELANVINEAALAAARRNGETVAMQDFEVAIDRIQLGLAKQGRALGPEERRRVAYHESGHALVALSVEHADPVHRVTIIPRSVGALGATLQLPTEERYLVTRAELVDRLCVMMGGRAAEILAFRDLSSGSENDLERASETAREMVLRLGMSDRLGPVSWSAGPISRFLDVSLPTGEPRTFSEETARAIDEEVREVLDAAERRALAIVERRRRALDALAERLQHDETLERATIDQILTAVDSAPASGGAAIAAE